MEHKISCDSVYDHIPLLSPKYPWFVALEDEERTGDSILYTIHKPLHHYRCRIPELQGRQVRAFFHGWVILSNHPQDIMWSLWNPLTSKLIRLPPLIYKEEDRHVCCLSSPPDDPSSIFLLTTEEKPTIIFCRLDRKRKKLRWTEMSYAKQLRSIIGVEGFLHRLTCYNGKVYALHTGYDCDYFVILVDIVVKEKEVVINLLRFMKVPDPSFNLCPYFDNFHFIKGSCTEVFYVQIGFEDVTSQTVNEVFLFKLHVASMTWEEIEDLKDAVFFIQLATDYMYYSIFFTSSVASEFGGYIHILDEKGKTIYSYHVKERTISLSYVPPLIRTSQVSSWAMLECRLEGNNGEGECNADFKQEEEDKHKKTVIKSVTNDDVEFKSKMDKSHILNLPLYVLETIMDLCVGVEYVNFRATCKHCYLAAPPIPRSNKATFRRLQTYSLVSSWLMVLDNHRGIITFKDPLSGDKYFIKTPKELIDYQIYCSRYGWLLMFNVGGSMVFYNPFTSDIRELPNTPRLESCSFSSPPTSPDCMVFGFLSLPEWKIYIHFVAREPFSRTLHLDLDVNDPYSLCFPTYYAGDLYALSNDGELYVFKDLDKEDYSWECVVSCSKSAARYFQVKCDQHLLLVMAGRFGESVRVFKLDDSTEEWEKLDSLGKHMIYICDTTCVCLEAKTPEMENKIYFPRMHNGKIVCYSLETCTYHTFNGKNVDECLLDFLGTTQYCYPHSWIEPSLS